MTQSVCRLVRFKLIVFLVFAAAGLGFLALRSVYAMHTVPCTNAYGQLANGHPQTGSSYSTWDDANFHYQVFVFGTFADNAGRKGDRIDSAHCWNAANPADPEFVQIDNPSNDLRWLAPGGVRIRPIEARLGVPRDPGNNDGAWMNRPPTGVVPTDRPPVYQFAQYRAAALVDDAGLAVINSQKLWCIGMGSSPTLTAAERPLCQDALSFNPAHGAGYMFVDDNCVNGADPDGRPLNCADGNNFNWYRFWYPSANYTGTIGLRGDGTLNDFRLHMESLQLVDGTGFGTYMFMTFKYPKPTVDAACAGISAPGSVRMGDSFSATISMRNSGGVMWTAGNQWLTRFNSPNWTGPNDIGLPPPGLFNAGETASFSFSGNAPNTPGTYPFNWRMANGSGGFGEVCYGSILVYQPYDYRPYLNNTFTPPVISPGSVLDFLSRTHNAVNTNGGPPATIQAYYYTIPYGGGPSGLSTIATWPTAGIPPLTYEDHPFNFVIPAGAADGTLYCFVTSVSPALGNYPSPPIIAIRYSAQVGWDDGGNVAANDLCYQVENPRFPYLTTSGGDVHAGGGIGEQVICPSTRNDHSIEGRANASKGQYIVSAGANLPDASYIRNFGSKNNPSGSELTFGNQGTMGRYGALCRPPLVTVARTYPSMVSLGSYSVAANLNLLSPDTLIKITPTTNINGRPAIRLAGGTPGVRSTIFVEGDVYIESNISRPAIAIARSAYPTFGLIASGNVYIAPGVQELYGFYYAEGSIDTCRNTAFGPNILAAGQANQCANRLQVSGLMMAQSFKFRRTGSPPGPGLREAEHVRFTGEIFVAPPPAFADQSSPYATTPRYDGERPPLR